MLVANAVVDTDQPRLQVGENQMDDRQVLLGNLWITTLGNSEVLIAALTEASIAAQSSVTISDELLSKVVYGLIMRRAILAFSIYEFDAANNLGEMIRSI